MDEVLVVSDQCCRASDEGDAPEDLQKSSARLLGIAWRYHGWLYVGFIETATT